MSIQIRRFVPLLLCIGVVGAAPLWAAKLDKKSKQWLKQVQAIVLPDEVEVYKSLKNRAERQEFEKIFWARRDATPQTPENEFQEKFEKTRKEADSRFRVIGRKGSASDCGRLYILIGPPDKVEKRDNSLVRGPRAPEVWTFKERPGFTFKGGELQLPLDADCQLPKDSFQDQLARVAAGLVVNPRLTYQVKDGKLVKLEDLQPRSALAHPLVNEPRQDFPILTQNGFLKAQENQTAILGLIKVDVAPLGIERSGDTRTVKVTVVAAAEGPDGTIASAAQTSVVAPVAADGSIIVSYKLSVDPGPYTVKAGLVYDVTGAGSLTSQQVEAPDFDSGQLSAATLFFIDRIEDVSVDDPKDPYGAFILGKTRFVPRFGHVFKRSEAANFFYQAYDGTVDAATGKPKIAVSLSLYHGKKVVARAGRQTYESPTVGSVVGPVALTGYEPGDYKVRVRVRDQVIGKSVIIEVPFTVTE